MAAGRARELCRTGVTKCLMARMDGSRSSELELLTGTKEEILSHPRLLRSLRFGHQDYDALV